ncbi:hypothetical protein C5E51_36275 [Nocardia nova]|nr:hypothetical protein C5E51_36275 [Nocardia nova]
MEELNKGAVIPGDRRRDDMASTRIERHFNLRTLLPFSRPRHRELLPDPEQDNLSKGAVTAPP